MSPLRSLACWAVVAALLVLAGPVRAEEEDFPSIGVSEPRYYSEAILQRMLASVQERIARAIYANEYALSKEQLGYAQGLRQTETVHLYNIRYRPSTWTTGTSTRTDRSGQVLNEQGEPVPIRDATRALDENLTTTTSSNPWSEETGSQIPSMEGETPVTAPSGLEQTMLQPPQGEDPRAARLSALQDLRERMALTFEQLNLQQLLSLSFWDRTQMERITVGFDVSVQPRSSHRHAVAELIVRIPTAPISGHASASRADQVALVHLFPRKESYNVLDVKRDLSDIGLGISLGPVGLGGRSQEAESQGYLVQDVDTVAVVNQTDDHVQFGWQFRPVLGRDYVEPGVRRVYAVLAVPRSQMSQTGETTLPVQVQTRWVRVDDQTGAIEDTFDNTAWEDRDLVLAQRAEALPDLLPGGDSRFRHRLVDLRREDDTVLVVLYGRQFSSDLELRVGHRAIDPVDAQGRPRIILGVGRPQDLLPEAYRGAAAAPQAKGKGAPVAAPARDVDPRVQEFLSRYQLPLPGQTRPKGPRTAEEWSEEPYLQTLTFPVERGLLRRGSILTLGNDWGLRSWKLLDLFGEEQLEAVQP